MTAGIDFGHLATAVPVTVNIALLPTHCTLCVKSLLFHNVKSLWSVRTYTCRSTQARHYLLLPKFLIETL